MWISADFENMNVPVVSTKVRFMNCRQRLHDDSMKKRFISKPIALKFKKLKNHIMKT